MNRSPLEAYETLMRFARERGEWPLRLAMHAAVAQSFRPIFLHLTKLNFLPEAASDPAVESDVLLAPFCEEIGAGYYQFDSQVRALLVDHLQSAYPDEGPARLRGVARFLLEYLEVQERSIDSTLDRLSQSYVDVQRWVALAVLDPEMAAHQLAAALSQPAAGPAAARVKIGGLVDILAEPLLRYPRLADYAAGVEALERGDVERARSLMSGLGDAELQVGSVKLRPARKVLEDWQVTKEPPSGERAAETPLMPCVIASAGGPEAERFSERLRRDLVKLGAVVRLGEPPVRFDEALILIGSREDGPTNSMAAEFVDGARVKSRPIIAASLDRGWSIQFKGTFVPDRDIDFSAWRAEDRQGYQRAFAQLVEALRPPSAADAAPLPHKIFIYHSPSDWRVLERLRSRLTKEGFEHWSYGPDPESAAPMASEAEARLRDADAAVVLWSESSARNAPRLPPRTGAVQPLAVVRLDRTPVPSWQGSVPIDARRDPEAGIRQVVDWLKSFRETKPEGFDIYLSYARADDGGGWVTKFRSALSSRLAMILGRPVNIPVHELAFGLGFDPDPSGSLSADVFIGIVSPRYLESKGCRLELESFTRGMQPLTGGRSRVIPVFKSAVPRDQLPEGLRDVLGYDFSSYVDEPQFAKQIDSLARDAARILRRESSEGLGAISGIVHDATGAVVPNAQVVVVNESKGKWERLTTTEAGVFTAHSLAPATEYSVTVKGPGFTPYEAKNIQVLAGQDVSLDVELTVAYQAAGVAVYVRASRDLEQELARMRWDLEKQGCRIIDDIGAARIRLYLVGASHFFDEVELLSEVQDQETIVWIPGGAVPVGSRQKKFFKGLDAGQYPNVQVIRSTFGEFLNQVLDIVRTKPPAAVAPDAPVSPEAQLTPFELLAASRRRAEADPLSSDYQRDLSAKLDGMGHFLRDQGKVAEALNCYHESLEIRQGLARSDPSNAGWQRDLAEGLDTMAGALRLQSDLAPAVRNQGHSSEALSLCRESLEIWRRLAASDPQSTACQRGLGACLYNLAGLLQRQGDDAGAMSLYRESSEARRRLLVLDASDTGAHRDLSITLETIGSVLADRGDVGEALRSYDESLRIKRKLVELDPDRADWRRELSWLLGQMSEILVHRSYPAASQLASESLQIAEDLAAQDPTNSERRADVVLSRARIERLSPAGRPLVDVLVAHGAEDSGAIQPLLQFLRDRGVKVSTWELSRGEGMRQRLPEHDVVLMYWRSEPLESIHANISDAQQSAYKRHRPRLIAVYTYPSPDPQLARAKLAFTAPPGVMVIHATDTLGLNDLEPFLERARAASNPPQAQA